MAEKQNSTELSSGQSTSKEAIQEIAQTVARELLSELKSASTQQQDSPPFAGMLNLSASLQHPRIKRSKRCSLISSNGMLPFGILAQQHCNSLPL